MGTLRTGKGRRRIRWVSLARLFHLHLNPLAATKLYGSTPILPAAPILPEHRNLSNAEEMQQQTHSARLLRCRPVPLTLLAQLGQQVRQSRILATKLFYCIIASGLIGSTRSDSLSSERRYPADGLIT